MMMNHPLFETANCILTEIDYESDPEIDSLYTQDLRYARYWCKGVTKPLSKNEMKKSYEKLEKKMDESKNKFHFAVRTKSELKLIGFVEFDWIYWNDHCGDIVVAIGNSDYLGKVEYELIEKLNYYGFHELNLHRIACYVSQFENHLEENLKLNGYLKEVTLREAEYFLNSYWDRTAYGILKSEWAKNLEQKS